MYRVMLVDDDLPVLEFLSSAIPWAEFGMEVRHCCKNGAIALERAIEEMPDLVITDIGMPVMDGLELLRELRSRDARIRAVVLSCMNEFSYAQQAIKLQVVDYLLKETMTVPTIVELLGRVAADLAQERQEAVRSETLASLHGLGASLRKRSFLENAARDGREDNGWEQEAVALGLPEQGEMAVALCRLDGPETADRQWPERLEAAASDASLLCLPRDEQTCVLIAWGDATGVLTAARLHPLRERLEQAVGEPVSLLSIDGIHGIGPLRPALAKLLASGLDYAFYLPDRSAADLSALPPFASEDVVLLCTDLARQMREAFLQEDEERITLLLQEWMTLARDQRILPGTVREWTFKMLYDNQASLLARAPFPSRFSLEMLYASLSAIGRVEELAAWTRLRFLERLEAVRGLAGGSGRQEILQAKRYVDRHVHSRITLEEAAGHISLNPSYFSRLFKKETGMSFIHYVTLVKMERAKEMLSQSSDSVERVSEQLGYENKSYFAKVFKMHTGKAPGEYRRA
ncbi:DNA-binding response regulator [Paenibacillus sp. 598K]|uniref:helix-turn-helix domain-containing protein n=1 Tax=Paenibacillus sp. 598K TaxID=1117987 RepID=UPI000FFA299D|nr:helix-turn-helix domain-containing protein [Paenibacillus sp. 598K]GBF71837.1 DNA-binding response regulator [Paenibacillus sp. 598K]